MITVVGLGVLVAISTALQAMQNGINATVRPYMLVGSVVAGVVAAWQLVAGSALGKPTGPVPAPEPRPASAAGAPAGTGRPNRRLRWWTRAVAVVAVLLASISIALQLRSNAAPTPPSANPIGVARHVVRALDGGIDAGTAGQSHAHRPGPGPRSGCRSVAEPARPGPRQVEPDIRQRPTGRAGVEIGARSGTHRLENRHI